MTAETDGSDSRSGAGLAPGGLYRLEPAQDSGTIEPGVYAVAGRDGEVGCVVLVEAPVDANRLGREVGKNINAFLSREERSTAVDLPTHSADVRDQMILRFRFSPDRSLEVVE